MNIIVNTQLELFLYAIAMGILLGMIYDLTRIFRKAIRHPNFLVQIEDGLYWILCAFIAFGILYLHNYGQLRIFVFLGMILGAIFYFATFSIVFMKIAVWIIDTLKRCVTWLVKMISIPIKAVLRLIAIPITYCYRVYCGQLEQHRRRRRIVKRKRYYIQADRKTEKKFKGLPPKE
ncbi:MAG: spore cortex biosynthesis protein YabQ [Cellulosilyticaceae bacterium]